MKPHKFIGRLCRLNVPTITGWTGLAEIVEVDGSGPDMGLTLRKQSGSEVVCMRHEVAILRRAPLSADAIALRTIYPTGE